MWRRAFTGLEIVMTGLVVAGLAAGLVLVKQNQNLNKLAACTPGQTSNQGCGANGCPTDSERVCECLSNGSWSCGCYAAANCAPTPAPTTPPTGDSCKPNGNSAGYCDGHNPGDNIGPCTCQFSSLGGGDCWCPSNLTCEQAGGTCYSGTTCSGQTPPRVVVNGGGGCNSGVCCGGASGGTTTAPTMPPAGATKTPTPGGSGACADAGGKCVGSGENCNYSDYGQKDCGLGYKCVPEMATCTTTPPPPLLPRSAARLLGACVGTATPSKCIAFMSRSIMDRRLISVFTVSGAQWWQTVLPCVAPVLELTKAPVAFTSQEEVNLASIAATTTLSNLALMAVRSEWACCGRRTTRRARVSPPLHSQH